MKITITFKNGDQETVHDFTDLFLFDDTDRVYVKHKLGKAWYSQSTIKEIDIS